MARRRSRLSADSAALKYCPRIDRVLDTLETISGMSTTNNGYGASRDTHINLENNVRD